MRPAWHVGVALGILGAAPAVTQSWDLAVATAATHCLVDVDHVIDYLSWSPKPRSLGQFFHPENSASWSRVVIALHGWEWVAALLGVWWFSGNVWCGACWCGLASHLTLDELGNRLRGAPCRIRPLFYFFTFRLARRFVARSLFAPDRAPAQAEKAR